MDTLPFFRRTIEDAGLEDVVVAVVGYVADRRRATGRTPLGLLFIDGGHAFDVALADYDGVGAARRARAGCSCSTTCSRTPPTAVRRRSTCGRRAVAGRLRAGRRRPAALRVLRRAVTTPWSGAALDGVGRELGFDLGAGGDQLLGREPAGEPFAAEQAGGRAGAAERVRGEHDGGGVPRRLLGRVELAAASSKRSSSKFMPVQ